MRKKLLWVLSITMLLVLVPKEVYAMHISEGMLPIKWCIIWGVICIPFFIYGLYSIKNKINVNSKAKILLAMCGAYCFLLSSLKLPSVTGSSSHPTGTGLGAIIFGPAAMTVLAVIVLLFQAILLAHGGLTTLGANTLSMAIVGPFIGYGVYKLCNKLKLPDWLSIFLTAFFADLSTYIVTSLELGLAFNNSSYSIMESTGKFMAVFAITQIPLAIVEGILTVLVYKAIKSVCNEEVNMLERI